MSRTVARPFGRPTATASSTSAPWQPTDSSASVLSYVLQDTPDDTPHEIHPHAAGYVTAQQASLEVPVRPRTLRQMTPVERTAWVQAHGSRPAAAPPPLAPATASSSSTSSAAQQQSAASPERQSFDFSDRAMTETAYPPEHLPDAPSSPFFAEDAGVTYSTSSTPAEADAPTPSAPSVAARPPRTSSLLMRPVSQVTMQAAGARALPPDGGDRPELEIVISRPGGQDITLRLFAPAR